jgi:hypothetical protein
MRNVELILKDIKDLHIRENFFRVKEFLNGQVLFEGDFKLFDVTVPQAEAVFTVKHGLTFIPQDIIPLHFEGDGNYYFRYQEFDKQNIYLTTVGPTRVRFLAGKLRDRASAEIRQNKLPFIAPGDVIAPASPGFVYAAVNQKSDLFWLTSEGIPSNVVGVPVLFANARVVNLSVGTENETNYTLGLYQHGGNESSLRQIGEVEVEGGGSKRFDVDFPVEYISENLQLACRLIRGNTTNLKVSLVVKGERA